MLAHNECSESHNKKFTGERTLAKLENVLIMMIGRFFFSKTYPLEEEEEADN